MNFGKGSQQISELLSSSDCTVEKLLDEESFLDELRSGSSELLDLYCAPHPSFGFNEISDLLTYIVVEPPDESDENRAFKYSYERDVDIHFMHRRCLRVT